jgi:hypothetical protein
MDDQQSGMPNWLRLDLTIIAVGLVLVLLGVWLGYADIQPLHILAKGPP